MDMSKSDDLINAKKPSPMTKYRSWEWGLQMVNHKKLTDFFKQTR